MKKHFPLLLVLALATALRLYQFGQIPSGINRDEAALGYNAYSILKTGRDEFGRFLPLNFESFGDWKQPIYIYLAIPFIFLFGLSVISVKLPALLAAISMIPAAYLLTQKVLTKTTLKNTIPLFTALLLALNPWHFHFSRQALEAIVAAAFLTWAAVFLTNRKTNYSKTISGFVFLFLSLFTYHGSLIVVPLWFLILWIFFFKTLKRNKTAIVLSLLFLSLTSLLFYNTFFSPEKVKAQGLVIFDLSNEKKTELIYSKRTDSFFSHLIYNQQVFFLRQFAINYSKTFTSEFLLTTGARHQNYNVPGYGNFFWPEIILAGFGVYWILKTRSKNLLFILAWVLIAPFPAAITNDAVHSTREIFLLPVVQITAAIGIVFIIQTFKLKINKLFSVLSLIMILVSWPFFSYYFNDYKTVSDNFFHGYFKQLSLDVENLKPNYSQIIFDDPHESPYIFYAFYTKLDPQVFHQTVEFYNKDYEGFRHVKKLDGLEFRVIDWNVVATLKRPLSNDLVIMRYEKLHDSMRPKQTWDNLGSEPELASIELRPI